MISKINFEEAYDQVDWDFLDKVMVKKVLVINEECGYGTMSGIWVAQSLWMEIQTDQSSL